LHVRYVPLADIKPWRNGSLWRHRQLQFRHRLLFHQAPLSLLSGEKDLEHRSVRSCVCKRYAPPCDSTI